MAHTFEMGPIESKTPEDMVRRTPSRAKSSLTDDRIAMSRMGATQELKVGGRPTPGNPHATTRAQRIVDG